MDIVYVIGDGSKWNNNEIRYSLRSVEKYMHNVGNVYIIGADPGFLWNVIYEPYPDIFPPSNAAGNVASKLLHACSLPGLSDNFLFFNDDFIVLRPIDANAVETYNNGDMATYPERDFAKNEWRRRMKCTFDALRTAGLPTLNYDYHAPMVFNKHLFPEVMGRFNYTAGLGLLFRSLYGNTLAVKSRKLSGEKKIIFRPFDLKTIGRSLAGATFMAFSDAGLNDALRYWLQSNFPDKSKYETSDVNVKITDRNREIREWLDYGQDFAKGVELFIRYSPNKRLSPRINLTPDSVLRDKLLRRLTALLSPPS